jgi:hypothetical protein
MQNQPHEHNNARRNPPTQIGGLRFTLNSQRRFAGFYIALTCIIVLNDIYPFSYFACLGEQQ